MNRYFLSFSNVHIQVLPGTRRSCLCLLLFLGLLLGACTPRTELTPITSRATGHQQPGQVVWHDLLTDDVNEAKQFYGQLFGWTFQEHEGYTLILNKGEPIAGIVYTAAVEDGSGRATWVTCLSVADVDEHAGWIEEIGGKVVQPPAEMGKRGRYCIVSDPQGAPLVLLRSATGDPEQTEPVMNGWMWDELWTSDPDAVLSFYQDLGDYSAEQVNPEEDGEPYWILVRDTRWQAGVTRIPFEDVPPQWVPVIRVDDPAAVAGQVDGLGGKVLVRPDKSSNDADVALIEDPSGGIVMVQAWEPEESPDKEQ